MSNIIEVHTSHEQDYPVHVGNGLADPFAAFCTEHYSGDQVFIVIDEKVNSLHRERVEKMCRSYFAEAHFIIVPEGEASKSVTEWNKIVNRVLETGTERNTPLLAVGGGVTGDLAGFVAASVLRGIPLIHMPTSLLAMVDSSIGGKTGINHKTGKNLIGAFYQPDIVFTDTAFLQTLAQKEWITGMAEILKYAAISNPGLFDTLEELARQEFSANEKWINVISESIRIKAKIVQEDTLEAGKRAFLNFGHTFAHALETVSGYGKISHGEAVFTGMIAATYYSKQLNHPVDEARFAPFIPLYQQQMDPLPLDIDRLVEAMKTDKKVKDNKLRLVLLNGWGSPYINKTVDISLLRDSWQYALSKFN
jgi:3-dehydroquinate synthase